MVRYVGFNDDSEQILGEYLKKFSFIEILYSADEFYKVYENNYWRIKISMLSNFPFIGVSFEFLSKSNETISNGILEKALGVNNKDVIKIYDKYFGEKKEWIEPERYKTEMVFCVEIIDSFYKKLLMGDFTFLDYQKENERS